MKKQNKQAKPGRSGFVSIRWIIVFAVLVIIVGAGLFIFMRRGSGAANVLGGATGLYTVKRGPLIVSVTEPGDIKAINSVDIKSEVEGRTKIISIVDEGTFITEADVNNGKILVELDASDIEQKLTEREVRFLSTEAEYTDANESLEIQKKENESKIKAGQLKIKFMLMDLKKYLGETLAQTLVQAMANPGSTDNKIAMLVNDPCLGGEALQKRRERQTDIILKQEELELAINKLDWTKKLYEKEYVSLNQLEADNLAKATKEIALEKAKTAKELFVRYEFPKQAEKFLSDYEEAKRELERIEARARSKLAQAQARLKSSRAKYLLQKKRLEKLQKQLKACVIKAPAPGQVVYSSSTDRWARRNRPIEIGADIQERQKIILIPDPSAMKVEIKIHEMWVNKIQMGQKTKITISAFPDKSFTGKVIKKSPLADPTNWWSNPDLKVYATDVCIDGEHDFLKTGMTAKVEVIIEKLQDVLTVPIQVVVNREGEKICYVLNSQKPEPRQVETGAFNANFVEIRDGLTEGEKVLLNPPLLVESEPEQE